MALTRDLVLQIRAVNRANQTLSSVRRQIEDIHAAVQALNSGQAINIGKNIGKSEGQIKNTTKAVNEMNKAISKTVHIHKELDGSVTKTTKYFDAEKKELTSLTRQMTTHTKTTVELAQKTSMLNGFMQGLTNSTRVSAVGFGKMIANNVTWLAGFALISATIGMVIKLLGDLTDRQNQFVKVSRLIATSTNDEADRIRATADAYDEFSRQLERTGKTAEEVAEAQYQLLSAGLSLEQANQGLGPALDLIDASMGEVTQTTKLLAGIMNNFGDTMYRNADGNIVFANSTKAVAEGLKANVTEGEKMAAVSNLLAVAFDKHQAEVNELRDGLKFAIPSFKAAGVGLDELVATLVTLEDHMIKSGRAGRSLRIMMASIAKDPDTMKKAFKTAFDPNDIDPFVTFMTKAAIEFDKIENKAEKLALANELFTSRGADAFMQITMESGKLVANLEEVRETGKQVDLVMADMVRSTPERAFRRLWESVVGLVDSFGAGGLIQAAADFAGGLADVISVISDVVRWISRFTRAIATLIPGFDQVKLTGVGIVDALKLQAKAWEWIANKIEFVGNAYEWLKGKVKGVAGSLKEWMDSRLKQADQEERIKDSIKAYNEELEDLSTTIKKAFDYNVLFANSMEGVLNVVSSMQIGQQLSDGLISASEASDKLTKSFAEASQTATLQKLGADLIVFNENIELASNKMEFFGDFVKNTVSVAVAGFQKATETVAALQEKLKNITEETSLLKLEMLELGGKGAAQLAGLADSLGIGASAALQAFGSTKSLTDQVTALTKEYDKAHYAGAKQEELIAIDDKVTKAKEKQSAAEEKAIQALKIAEPLIEKQLQTTEKLAKAQADMAKEYHAIAVDQAKTAKERESAAKTEEGFLEKQSKALEEAAKHQAKLSEMRFKQGYQDESSYQRDVINIYDETAEKISAINKKIGESQKNRLELQKKKEEEASKELKKAQTALERYDAIIKNIAKAIKDANIGEFASTIAGAFRDAKPDVVDMRKEVSSLSEELDRLTSKTHVIKIIKKTTNESESRAMGGLAGYATRTNVSAGEGFIPPSVVKHNLPALQALNQGNAVPFNHPISGFHGAPGIDNIQTSLPTGSFVMSKRGMAAFERSSSRSADAIQRRNFQLGGVVGGGSIGDRTQDDPGQNQTSRFDLVLNVGGEERKFPLFGQRAIINELANELEKQNLVRL